MLIIWDVEGQWKTKLTLSPLFPSNACFSAWIWNCTSKKEFGGHKIHVSYLGESDIPLSTADDRFLFSFFSIFFFSLVCEIKFSHCLFKMMGEIHCFCGNSSIPGSWLKFKLFTKFHQDQTPPEIRNHHPGKTEKADGGA